MSGKSCDVDNSIIERFFHLKNRVKFFYLNNLCSKQSERYSHLATQKTATNLQQAAFLHLKHLRSREREKVPEKRINFNYPFN